ncbi:MAG: hypothetical protein ABJB86_15700 [Bacteroidota bacterium]
MTEQIKRSIKNIPVRDTLFGDMPLDYWAAVSNNDAPWTLFKKAKSFYDDGEDNDTADVLREVISLPNLESRQYLQAYYFLKQLCSIKESSMQVLGIVAEVAMEGGTDLLAVYADCSARYYNYSGAAVIWETRTAAMDSKIENILSLGEDIVKNIGPWKYERPEAPKPGFARLNFLTPAGLHFGEAQQAVLFRDPMAGKIMYAMMDMMETLINLSEKK